MTTLTQYSIDPSPMARAWRWIRARKARRAEMFEQGDAAIREALKLALQGKWDRAVEQYQKAQRCQISASEVPIETEIQKRAREAGVKL